jgi:hypothetical protein
METAMMRRYATRPLVRPVYVGHAYPGSGQDSANEMMRLVGGFERWTVGK